MSEYLDTSLLPNIDGEQIAKLEDFAKMLVEKNKVMNLTSITAPDEIAVKHFDDSFTLLDIPDILPKGASVIDVGTGAGFPGVVLCIARDDLSVTLADSLRKRLDFIDEVLTCLNISGKTVHGRAEDLAKETQHREKYDLATARAVAQMSVLCEYCLPFVKVGGYFAAMKGPSCEEELNDAKNAIKTLGGKVQKVFSFNLPDGSSRSVIVIKKVSKTPDKYPRNPGKISKAPL